MRRSLLLCILLTTLAAPLAGQKCPVKPAVEPFQQEVSGPYDHFEWYSAYAPNPGPGNGNVFDRHVRNLGGKLLKYDWPVGGLHNFGLPPGLSDSLCVNYGRVNSAQGPLHHGRLNEASDTIVWRAEGQHNIVSRFTFSFSDKGGDPEVEILLDSTFDGQAYRYSLRNMSRTTVRVAWQDFKGVDLFQELKVVPSVKVEVNRAKETPAPPTSFPFEIGERSESIIGEQLKRGRTLEPGQAIPLHVESIAAPKLLSTNLDVGSIEGRPLAGAILPILVPGR